MRDNRVSRGGGIVVGPGNRNVIARNHVARAQESISATGRENLVARNVVVDARGRGISLGVDFADGPDFGGVDNIVRRNVVKRSGGNGFLVNHKGSYVLKRNVATGAKDDGFDVESRSTRLAKNRATRNAALGIKAVKGVIDGGGNRAQWQRRPAPVREREMPLAGARVTLSKPPVCRSRRFSSSTSAPRRAGPPSLERGHALRC